MGLFAVAYLAARHGIKVALGLPPGGGTTAEVRLPAALISQDAEPGGWPGRAGEVLRAGAGRGADAVAAAADPWPSLPRFAAGPESPVGPEIAMPEAVPLTLGAPLPSPARATSFAVTVPEPMGAELGGALPIFESVESDYSQTRGRGLTSAGLPQRIPQANLIPGAAGDRETRPGTAAEAAQIARSRLDSFQRGSRRARAMARMDRDAKQPAQDD
jgi:hypothetical protein